MTSRTRSKTLRIAGYVRLSRETDESTSVARQREIIAETCRARGWEHVETFEDVDVSATKRRLDRPGLDALRAAVRARRVDAVLVWRLDRMARSVGDLATLVEEFDSHGVALVSATEPFDATTSAGRMLLQLLGVFAEFEAATIRDRVTAARQALVDARRWPGGAAPFGYATAPNPDGPGRVLVVDPGEAADVRAAADHVLSGGSLYGAVQALRERGSKPRRAAAWSISSLRVVLTGDAALGRLTHRGDLVRDDDGLPVAPWEPILPLADVERLRVLLERKPGRGFQERKRATRLLSGLVKCGTCGGNMRVSTSTQTSTGKRVVRYACQGKSDGRGCAAPASVTAGLLEAHVEEEFLRRFGRLEVVHRVERVREVAGLAEVEGALRDLGAAITRPGADVGGLSSQIAALQEKRDALASAPLEPVVETVRTGVKFRDAWHDTDDEEAASTIADRRALLTDAIDSGVYIAPGQRGRKGLDASRVEVDWRR